MNYDDDILIAKPAPLQRRWSDRFALDLAMCREGSGGTIEDLLEAYGFTEEDLVEFTLEPLFEQRVTSLQSQLREKGLTFRMKAQVQAELLLENSWDIINGGPEVSPAVKADLIKWTAKVAGFDTVKDASQDGKGVSIHIHMGDPALAPPSGIRTIEHD